MDAVTVFSPAKINLFLAITGRRADGFHELVSVVAPLEFGDRLRVEIAAPGGAGRGRAGPGRAGRQDEDATFSLECTDSMTGGGAAAADTAAASHPAAASAGDEAAAAAAACGTAAPPPAMPLDGTNLVLRAARAFRAASGWPGGARFFLEKRIPVGAGLGGGSSNATATLRALNLLAARAAAAGSAAPAATAAAPAAPATHPSAALPPAARAAPAPPAPLPPARLAQIASSLGSDCALFLHDAPVVMRGRGERIEPLPPAAAVRLRGRRLLLFKPAFGIPTAWAYARMAAAPARSCLPPPDAEARLRRWLAAPPGDPALAGPGALLFNNMQPPVLGKFIALPALLEKLRRKFALPVLMSGSGSACFALLPDTLPAPALADITACIRAAWGRDAFVMETKIR
ncbi:MAG: 4-(cytidine 5'-diphospho)-2-C-methyl-D-erythritol kinase [Opitutaceae bacterium]|jgi:4-diphosphocytidyl-2-C-methyl-D-erythritol kinase|nr:4-(cytidine 5'-diphospho)-2-C-methyl-D-erythritol kinase [Opitutaceae bacterium]